MSIVKTARKCAEQVAGGADKIRTAEAARAANEADREADIADLLAS